MSDHSTLTAARAIAMSICERPCSRAAALALVAIVLCGNPTHAEDQNSQVQRVMKTVYPALVRIRVVIAEPQSGRLQKMRSAGSGTIISSEGYVVTNHHVVGNATHIVCDLPDHRSVEAKLIGTDALSDIAVVKLDLDQLGKSDNPLPVAEWGDSAKLRVGDPVYALGSPAALSQSVTAGIVSNTGLVMNEFVGQMKLDGENVGSIVKWISHDAQIIGGNSGGPLVDGEGRIVGVNEIGIETVSGAIPGNLAREVAQQLIRYGRVRRSWIGLEAQTRLRSYAGSGVLVGGILPESPVAIAGLKPGDVITHVNDDRVDARVDEDLPRFNMTIMGLSIGSTIDLRIVRDGETMNFRIKTVEREPARNRPNELRTWGLVARDLTRLAMLKHHRPDNNGVLVDSIRSGSAASEARPPLAKHDIIVRVGGKPVDNIAQLRQQSKALTKGKTDPIPVLVALERGGKSIQTVLQLGPEPESHIPLPPRKAWLGVETQVLTDELANALDLPETKGVVVTQVYSNMAGSKAGLVVGDVIVRIDKTLIDANLPEHNSVFSAMIRRYRIGSEVELDVRREGKPVIIKAMLAAPPAPAAAASRTANKTFEFTARDLVFADRVKHRLAGDLIGVLIVSVEDGGWASLAKLKKNDILIAANGQPTRDVASLKAIMNRAEDEQSKRIVFFVRRGIHTKYLEVKPSWN